MPGIRKVWDSKIGIDVLQIHRGTVHAAPVARLEEHGVAVDVHAHYVAPQVLTTLMAQGDRFPSIQWKPVGQDRVCFQFPGEPWTRPMHPALADLDQRQVWMKSQGIRQQWLSGWLDIFGTGLPDAEARAWCRLLNEGLAEAIQDRGEFRGVATVPLASPEAAANELRYALQHLNFCAVTIPTYVVAGMELDDVRLEPFWAMAEATRVPVLVHPGYAGGEARMAVHELANTVGRIAETTLVVARMIYGGVFSRHPNLTVVLMHGGGFLPYQAGRLHQGFLKGVGVEDAMRDPDVVLPGLYYDSLVFRPEALRLLAEVVGADHIVLGSDFPFGLFALGDPAPLDAVRAAGLGDNVVTMLQETACRLEQNVRHGGA